VRQKKEEKKKKKEGKIQTYPKAWDDICRPKDAEGLDIRKMQCANVALTAKIGLDLANQRRQIVMVRLLCLKIMDDGNGVQS